MRILGKIFKTIFLVVLLTALLAGGCIFYAFKIEPYRITANEYTLGGEADPIKIVQISDIHVKEDFTSDNLKKIVEKVNREEPDIVAFTGDLYDNYAKYHDNENVAEALGKIRAKDAKIAIWGNRDYGGGASRKYEDIMEKAGFTLLKNEHYTVKAGNGETVFFTGLDDALLGSPDMPEREEGGDYRILLFHEPDCFDDYMDYDYDIALSGHSHGGQVDIPFLPSVNARAVAVTAMAEEYSGGMYEFPDAETKKLYVNTGIGTTHISARFGVVPEITVFHMGK